MISVEQSSSFDVGSSLLRLRAHALALGVGMSDNGYGSQHIGGPPRSSAGLPSLAYNHDKKNEDGRNWAVEYGATQSHWQQDDARTQHGYQDANVASVSGEDRLFFALTCTHTKSSVVDRVIAIVFIKPGYQTNPCPS